ncbi:MAG: serine hydroxymethyltransferase [Clostridia bacterium]|nr:serine hydroxymethyltransferase [Clostridia bacterium]
MTTGISGKAGFYSMSDIQTIFNLIEQEKARQSRTIELIASENFVSENVLKAAGSCLTNKYAEGYPGKRYYGGCHIVDQIESLCREQWKQVFHTDYHVNVQPHSGSQANGAAYAAVLKPGDTILSMSLDNGAHLTHGSPVNFSGKLYNVVFYNTDDNGYISMDDVRAKALECHPQLILAGASAYPRVIDFAAFRRIADEVGSLLMVDIAHIAGLVAAGCHPSPFEAGCDIITTTTHTTLRGPRGGLIFCKPELAKKVDSAVFPGNQGGPLEHIVAAKAIAAVEACDPSFADYIRNVVANCKAMAEEFVRLGYDLVTGGTDNHLFLVDLTRQNVTGKALQNALDECDITLNKNCMPNEQRSPMVTSGVRVGTAAMTTRGMSAEGFIETARVIDRVVKALQNDGFNEAFIASTKADVAKIIAGIA